MRVRVSQMAIGFGNEQASVLVPDPVRDRLEINSFLDCIANEEMSQAMMRISEEDRQCDLPYPKRPWQT